VLPDEQFYQFIRESIASHDRQLGEITDDIARLKDRMDNLTVQVDNLTVQVDNLTIQVSAATLAVERVAGLMAPMLDSMKVLADTVQNHERRFCNLENPA
jgi:hypothetical protein